MEVETNKNNKAKVYIVPMEIEVEINKGKTIIEALDKAGVMVEATCGRKGTCGKCRVKILSPPPTITQQFNPAEKKHLTDKELEEGITLSCIRKVQEDMIIEVKDTIDDKDNKNKTTSNKINNKLKNQIKKEVQHDLEIQRLKNLELDSNIQKLKVKLSDTNGLLELESKEINSSEFDRIVEPLRERADLKADIDVGYIGLDVLQKLPETIFTEDEITAVINTENNNRVINFEKGDTTGKKYGIVIDIGTTGVKGYLADLNKKEILSYDSMLNFQVTYGGDIISRLNYAVENKENSKTLQDLVLKSINKVLDRLIHISGVNKEYIYETVVVGNTTMLHLFLDIVPTHTNSLVYKPIIKHQVILNSREVGLNILPSHSSIIVLPSISATVGADALAVTMTLLMDKNGLRKAGKWAIIDIGTNGEIIIFDNEKIITCSTAAGPAFEGGKIKHGMRVKEGAIREVKINKNANSKTNALKLDVIGESDPVGISGTGIVSAISEFLINGIVEKNARIKNPEEWPTKIRKLLEDRYVNNNGEVSFVLSISPEITITQQDIIEIQLAKGAINAGIMTALKERDISIEDLDGIYVAGALGSHIDREYLINTGILPPVDIEKIIPIGNAAGEGGLLFLNSRNERKLAYNLANEIEAINLAIHQGFKKTFSRSLYFPTT
ncbi:ASKHA domain-containing protein [Natranaerofaba carboxydovora]|uniref:ASKHA domain-containing protein n=1 Tax=Natranaerofaba carboxydovora TaxID=2742683 RepID=UPI001F14599E|nr:ASKHA domain-containing protein [Natranaerofaba carboxydovora]UMZ74767.1 hypothetical protein ACONDI_02370 [Natranaerofaba carboxydovora]